MPLIDIPSNYKFSTMTNCCPWFGLTYAPRGKLCYLKITWILAQHSQSRLSYASSVWQYSYVCTCRSTVHCNRPGITRWPRRPWPSMPFQLAVMPLEKIPFSRPKLPCSFFPLAVVPFFYPSPRFSYWHEHLFSADYLRPTILIQGTL